MAAPAFETPAGDLAYLREKVRLYFNAVARVRVLEQADVTRGSRYTLERRDERIRHAQEDVTRIERELLDLVKEGA